MPPEWCDRRGPELLHPLHPATSPTVELPRVYNSHTMASTFDHITPDRPSHVPDAAFEEAGLNRAWVMAAPDDDDEDDLDDAEGDDGDGEDEDDEDQEGQKDPPGWSD